MNSVTIKIDQDILLGNADDLTSPISLKISVTQRFALAGELTKTAWTNVDMCVRRILVQVINANSFAIFPLPPSPIPQLSPFQKILDLHDFLLNHPMPPPPGNHAIANEYQQKFESGLLSGFTARYVPEYEQKYLEFFYTELRSKLSSRALVVLFFFFWNLKIFEGVCYTDKHKGSGCSKGGWRYPPDKSPSSG